jgi:AcrR family transcriptional regulator
MKRQRSLDEIYDASLKVFAEYGFKKATVEDIAGSLDMTKGALYVYVRDKKDLYYKSVAYGFLKWQNRVKQAVESEKDVKKQFGLMCCKALEYLSEDDNLRKILVKDPGIFPVLSGDDPYFSINENSMGLLKSILQRGINEKKFRNIDTESVAKIIFSIYKMFIVETYVIDDTKSPGKVFDDLIELVTMGLFNQ